MCLRATLDDVPFAVASDLRDLMSAATCRDSIVGGCRGGDVYFFFDE